ncbi:hypothetical protein [Isoptericola sp. NPDC056573]|uniref:hypothetical protein n=1 Tax=unclassified Isoptericola TaxID=2623355 RepID=UPI003679D576
MTSSRYTELLAQARQELGVPEAAGITDVVALLGAWGATPMPVGSFDTNLCDEYVDEALVVYQASIDDVHLIAEHLTDDEREGFSPDDSDEGSDDLEATNTGATDDWSEVSDDLDAGRRVIVLLERDRADSTQVGNFRVHGAGQWIRERLWAATGVLPRDPGSSGSDFYSQALDLARPGRPDVPTALYDRLPGWLWSAYVAFMRPRWRRARDRRLGADVED